MTLPDERYRAVLWAYRFLTDIAHDRKKYPRMPKEVRQEAYSILRHYPSPYDMLRASEDCPHIFCETMEPVTKMFQKYEDSKNEENK